MKYLKMLGLAAVAAMALMAFLGAGNASATALCKTTVTECPAEWHYPKGTEIHATLEPESSATLRNTTGSIQDTCTESTVAGLTETTGGAAETVKGKVTVRHTAPITTDLTFGGCNNTTDVLEGGELEIHSIEGSHNGTLTAKGFKVTINLGVSCVFTAGAGIDLGTLTSGSMATMDVSTVVSLAEGGFLCPTTAVWEAKYTVTKPEPLYVSVS